MICCVTADQAEDLTMQAEDTKIGTCVLRIREK
jgi:hypothetical protein